MMGLELDLGGIEADRPMQAGFSYVPRHMELAQDAILWAGPFKDVRPAPGLLEDFVELCDRPDQEIFGYAQKWGVLGICKHSLPASHNNYPFGAQHRVKACFPLPSEKGEFWHADPLEHWRYFSRKFRALRDIGAQVNQNQAGKPSDWRLVSGINVDDPPWKRVRRARAFLSWVLEDLLAVGQVRPSLQWDGRKQQWQIDLGAHSTPNLFGLVSLSLVLSVSRRDLVVCSCCQTAYVPPRRPNPERRNYCPKCGKKAAQRDAARAYRTRLRQKECIT